MNSRLIRAAVALTLVALAAGGCASTAARQTDIMQQAGATISKRELQVFTYELVTRCTGIIEVTATSI